MRRIATLVALFVATAWIAGVSAQDRPNFAGKWTLVADPAAPPPAGGRGGRGMGGWGQTITITQDAKILKLERMQGETAVTETYNLDGTDSEFTVPAMGRQGGDPVKVKGDTDWEGKTLVLKTERTMTMQGNTMKIETKRVLLLDASGNLVVESTTTGMGDQPMVSKVTYKKG